MRGHRFELLAAPLRAMRRAAFWWAIGLAGIVAATVAFWPAFQGSSGLSAAMDQLPAGVVEAFGLQDFGTPAGFLRGNLYELLIPLLFALAAVTLANGQLASEEANGRLELVFAQPVDRRAVYAGRAIAVLVALGLLTLVLAATQLAVDAAVGLRIDTGYLVSTIALCSLLGALHGSAAVAISGIAARPSVVLGLGVALAIGGYLVAALLPLSSALAPWAHASPWDWALAGHPLERATDAWRFAALAVPSIVLISIGVFGVGRRDVAAA